jgi:hypothetical protein
MAIASVGIEEFSTWAVDQIDYKDGIKSVPRFRRDLEHGVAALW